jgi:hypothetical protein
MRRKHLDWLSKALLVALVVCAVAMVLLRVVRASRESHTLEPGDIECRLTVHRDFDGLVWATVTFENTKDTPVPVYEPSISLGHTRGPLLWDFFDVETRDGIPVEYIGGWADIAPSERWFVFLKPHETRAYRVCINDNYRLKERNMYRIRFRTYTPRGVSPPLLCEALPIEIESNVAEFFVP